MTLALHDVNVANPGYFSRERGAMRVRFSSDLYYRILHSKQGTPYLVRKTYGGADMFDGGGRTMKEKRMQRIAHYRINPIGANLEILPLDDRTFATLADVRDAVSKLEKGG